MSAAVIAHLESVLADMPNHEGDRSLQIFVLRKSVETALEMLRTEELVRAAAPDLLAAVSAAIMDTDARPGEPLSSYAVNALRAALYRARGGK